MRYPASEKLEIIRLVEQSHQKPWIVPIPGTGNLEHLKENSAPLKSSLRLPIFVKSTAPSQRITVQGDRLPAEHRKLIDR